MAGLGAKLFASFSKLTAAQVNGYLMDQSIMRFADATARDAAFGGAGEPTLAEGMTCYLDDTNVLQSYTGSVWVSVAASQTTANVSSGLVYIAGGTQSGSTALNVDNVFTTTYRNYRLVMTEIEVATVDRTPRLNFRTGGATNTTANYNFAYRGLRVSGAGGDIAGSGLTYTEIGTQISNFANAQLGAVSIDIMSPQATATTFGTLNAVGYEALAYQMRSGGFVFGTTTSFDGFQINLNGAGNVAFKWQLYGYRTA
jgi:hypothetical protein